MPVGHKWPLDQRPFSVSDRERRRLVRLCAGADEQRPGEVDQPGDGQAQVAIMDCGSKMYIGKRSSASA